MPTSDYHHISDVLHVVEQCQPKRVLDVGVGFGKWGMLCREVLDVYQERLDRSTWQAAIHGIEIHAAYRNALWAFAYDEVFVGDVRDVLPRLSPYDLVLCNDVIEHFEKADGLALLHLLVDKGGRVIVTSPRGYAPQDANYDNPHQRHLSGWTRADFAGFPHLYKDIGFTFMAIVARDWASLDGLAPLDPLEALGVRRGTSELAKLAVRRAVVRLQR